jgi:hypothetical protein
LLIIKNNKSKTKQNKHSKKITKDLFILKKISWRYTSN